MAGDEPSAMDEQETPAATEEVDSAVLESANDPDAVRNAIRAQKEAAKQYKKERDEFAARVAEYENQNKSEYEKLTERASQAQKELELERLHRLRLEVALEKGLVGDRAKLAARLSGTTREELVADADDLLALLSPEVSHTSFDGGARGTQPTEGGMDGMIRRAAGR